LQQEIRLTGELLAETQRSAEVSLNQLVMLNSQISRREQLLGNIQLEIRLINNRINTLTQNIAELEEELEALKEAYAQMIRLAARNKDALQRMMFIFSAESFNQAYLRVRYLQQYSYHRKLQAEKLAETNVLLAEQKVALEAERNKQQAQLKQQREQVRDLNIEKASQERTVSELKTQEQQLMQQLREQERAARELQNAIRRIIEEERRRARERAEAEGRVATDMYALTPEEQLLSDNFAGNKGSLPWPLERGIITGHFGEQPHPVLPGIKISNNGLNISTSEGARARSIFEGKVSRIITVPGGFYAIIIRHGEYLSVYSNLSEVFVTNGQTVNTRDELGVVGTNHRESKTYLHLEIWKGNEKQNPASWIARQHQ
jgi:murein hydrolase activator